MRQFRVMAFLGLIAVVGCGDTKTQVPTKKMDLPQAAPVGGAGGGGGGEKGAPTTKAS